ncbi:DUF6308 family protein [Dactylosporangium matsuzakiense]|uniref:Uncharacterized protein n=1 Tax=Dactylosporangium matsuzakiense TaxID=53360 RepID=A0A9W6KN87_9ACTN|nr:DUF6308 family protein [Dactylosporangium matsuzakiense]GLL05146.1 hypothetical protein GCM10017581_068930 [Dactylosporangium matsuzakiense]
MDELSADEFVYVGALRVPRGEALAAAHAYLNPAAGVHFAYPAYEAYQPHHDPDQLDDADLLAPVLLNVNRLSLQAYYGLRGKCGELGVLLRKISRDARLEDAGDDGLNALGSMFAVLDGDGLPGVGGSILAKILHRKRPGFIPLYDDNVRHCYRDAAGAPIPRDSKRAWAEFGVLLGKAIRHDLEIQLETWREICAYAPGPAITPLRALDIVAWHAGRRSSRR